MVRAGNPIGPRKSGLIAAALVLFLAGGAQAGGSESVTIGGAPAQRAGDQTAGGGIVLEGSPDVLINGRPAAVVGGAGPCGNGVAVGSPSVFINGKPAAVGGGSALPPCK